MLTRFAMLLIMVAFAVPLRAETPHGNEAHHEDVTHANANMDHDSGTPQIPEGETKALAADPHDASDEVHIASPSDAAKIAKQPPADAMKPAADSAHDEPAQTTVPSADGKGSEAAETRHEAAPAANTAPETGPAHDGIKDIRIGQHEGFIRVVVDLATEAPSTRLDGKSLFVSGIKTGSAVFNADRKQAPLKRILIEPREDGAELTFETSDTVRLKTFALTPDSYGGHRLVVDLGFNSRNETLPPAKQAGRPVTAGGMAAVPGGPERQAATIPATTAGPAAFGAATGAPIDITRAIPEARIGAAAGSESGGPQSASPLALAADEAMTRGETDDACRMAGQATGMNAGDLLALAVKGDCALERGDIAAARVAYSEALKTDPSFSRAHIGLAEAETAAGNPAAARAHYENSLALRPPTDEALKIIAAMNAL